MEVSGIYKSLERGNFPDQKIVRDADGRIDEMLTQSQRNDIIAVQHIEDGTYKAMRVIPETQSRNNAIQDMMRNPGKQYSLDFQHCNYQLLIFEAPEFREEDSKHRHQSVHMKCHWNSKDATRLRTARSPRSLEKAWQNHI